MPTVFAFLLMVLGFYTRALLARAKAHTIEKNAELILNQAKKDAEVTAREAQIQARDEVIRARDAFEAEIRSRRQELMALEERIAAREANLDRKLGVLDKKEQVIDDRVADLEKAREALRSREAEVQAVVDQERAKLQQIAALSQEEARRILMQKVEEELRTEMGGMIRRYQEEAKATAEKEAREIITTAIQRYASEQVAEVTTSTLSLPNDEMKGRIIGREGRNIRALEAATGVNFLIDDTPEVVVISSFDPMRREVARVSLERLMADGRIHPARIEEVVTKVREEVDEVTRAAGEEAIFELGLQGVAPELVRTLGRLKFRQSFAQNVLRHSIETAHLMGMMATDLGLDAAIAKRVGLFHDIGKALDHQVEGNHAIIGADLLRRCGESAAVVNAVAAHHGEVESGGNLYASLATAADAISASRPGARSETTAIYLKRLEKLEEIASSFRGVEKSYAMQAGREIRVIVEPGKIDDNEAMQMARNISKQIEQEMKYPGQIKITVIRETRCVEYAK
ncbi:MAG: ribonuclease Y [Verrucomicrobia bacterium]|nr:ribonuclease Y [Verrucomicrobiota bacterium]